MASSAEFDSLKSMILSFRVYELCNLLLPFKKNIKGKKHDLQQRAIAELKTNNREFKNKVKELSKTMYKSIGSAPSVNPYSANYSPRRSCSRNNKKDEVEEDEEDEDDSDEEEEEESDSEEEKNKRSSRRRSKSNKEADNKGKNANGKNSKQVEKVKEKAKSGNKRGRPRKTNSPAKTSPAKTSPPKKVTPVSQKNGKKATPPARTNNGKKSVEKTPDPLPPVHRMRTRRAAATAYKRASAIASDEITDDDDDEDFEDEEDEDEDEEEEDTAEGEQSSDSSPAEEEDNSNKTRKSASNPTPSPAVTSATIVTSKEAPRATVSTLSASRGQAVSKPGGGSVAAAIAASVAVAGSSRVIAAPAPVVPPPAGLGHPITIVKPRPTILTHASSLQGRTAPLATHTRVTLWTGSTPAAGMGKGFYAPSTLA